MTSSHLRIARRGPGLAAIAAFAVSPVTAAAPVAVDPITALVREYARDNESTEYLNRINDASYARYVLDRPDSPYSNVKRVALSPPDAPTRRAIESVSTYDHPLNQRDLHDLKVWDLGFTKARPSSAGFDIPADMKIIPGARSFVKAGVERDIFILANRHYGRMYPALTANYVLAAQLLREKLTGTSRSLWNVRGLRHDVLERLLRGEAMHAHDFHYLIQFLDGELATWDAGGISSYGHRQLPSTLRLGRTAAAFRQRLPFDVEPCGQDGDQDPSHAGTGGFDRRPLCFDDATDRAVHAWYARELAHELESVGPGDISPAGRMAAPLRSSRQGWIGIRRPDVIGDVTHIEVVEAKALGQLITTGDVSYGDALDASRRALSLTCGRRL
jgi:hypothetical protein